MKNAFYKKMEKSFAKFFTNHKKAKSNSKSDIIRFEHSDEGIIVHARNTDYIISYDSIVSILGTTFEDALELFTSMDETDTLEWLENQWEREEAMALFIHKLEMSIQLELDLCIHYPAKVDGFCAFRAANKDHFEQYFAHIETPFPKFDIYEGEEIWHYFPEIEDIRGANF